MRLTTSYIKRKFPGWHAMHELIDWVKQIVQDKGANATRIFHKDVDAAGEHQIEFRQPLPNSSYEVWVEGRSGKKKIVAHVVEGSENVNGFAVYVREACRIVYFVFPQNQ